MLSPLLHAFRRLAARPAQSLLAIGILSLGLGATMFLFGAINGMVLSPLPFPHAERLVSLGYERGPGRNMGAFDANEWLALQPVLSGFDAIAIDGDIATVNLSHEQRATRYDGAFIGASLLPLLGVEPLLGRGFNDSDDAPGAPLAVLLGERVWRNDFKADPAVIGRTLRANGENATVVGVLPASFGFPRQQEVWLPRRLAAGDGLPVNVIARLAPDTTAEQARQALAALEPRLATALHGLQEGDALGIDPLSHRFVNDVTRRMMWMMFGAGLLVLLLACANVANLQLAQVLSRRRELAVRSALGAGRGRLLRDLLAESLLMSAVAGIAGFGLASLGGEWVMRSMVANSNVPAYYIDFSTNARDVIFSFGVALVTCLLAGLIPALRGARTDVQEALRDGSKGSHGGVFARISRALVVGEIALTVVLLVGTAMFVLGIRGMVQFDFGTRTPPEQILTGRIGVFPQQFPTPADQHAFFERVALALRADPQVLSATVGTGVPGSQSGGDDGVRALGAAKPDGGDVEAEIAAVDPHFAEVYGIGLLAGRHIDARDTADSAPVVVIDETLARALFPGRDALGQRLQLDPDAVDAPVFTVVGITPSLHMTEVDARALPVLLRPFAQAPTRFASVAVHVRGDAAAFAPRLAEIVRGVDADTPVYWNRTHADAIRLGRVGPTLLAQIFSGVGILALLLAASGLYGVLAFSVAQRTREIGIRRAVGAGGSGVVAMVTRRIAWQVALGLGIGVLLGVPWSVVLADPVLNTRGGDPVVFASVVAVILLVAALSSVAPLRRALRVDPLTALRQD